MKKFACALAALLSSIAFGATTVPVQLLNPTGSTSGQAIVSTGSGSAPAWGNVTLAGLASIAANTLVANASSASAAPSAFAMPSCSGASSALAWTTNAGFNCNTSINAATITGAAQFDALVGTGSGAVGSISPGSTGGIFTSNGTSSYPSFQSTISNAVSWQGITNGSAASAGNVFEVICAQVTNGGSPTGCATNSSTPVSLTSGITSNVTSITLTPGNWRVWGQVLTIPAGSTTQSVVNAAISPTSTSFTGQVAEFLLPFSAPAGSAVGGALNPMPIRVTTNTTYYLIVNSTFAISTNTAIGFIAAQRTN